MLVFLYYAAAFIIFAHGIIHLIGVAVYWQLAVVNEIPYKTTLLGGRWDIGDMGMRIFRFVVVDRDNWICRFGCRDGTQDPLVAACIAGNDIVFVGDHDTGLECR